MLPPPLLHHNVVPLPHNALPGDIYHHVGFFFFSFSFTVLLDSLLISVIPVIINVIN